MKNKLTALTVLAAFLAMSSGVAFAGDHCESMHKNMSAEQWQAFKKSHEWVFSDDGKAAMDNSGNHDGNKAADHKPLKEDRPAKTSTGLIGA